MALPVGDLCTLADGFDASPYKSHSLPKAYVETDYLALEKSAMFLKSWQYVCHVEALCENGSYVTLDVQGQPVVVLRDSKGVLRAFYNVCRHRGHELLKGEGKLKTIVCPYHAWCYHLDGTLYAARHSETVENFDFADFSLMPVQVEEFCSMIWVNLDSKAEPLHIQSGELAKEIEGYASDLATLTHSHWSYLI